MSNFMGVGIFWIGLNRADLGCWRLTLEYSLKYSNIMHVRNRSLRISDLDISTISHSISNGWS